MNLILLDPGECDAGEGRLRGERARHILDVLKLPPGGVFRVGLVNGPRGRGTVLSREGDALRFCCTWEAPPERPRTELILAVPRPKVLKRLWPQLAALGVRRIRLVNAAKVEKPYFASHVLRPDFYVPLLREGLQQACDTWMPEVEVIPRLRPFVEDRAALDYRDCARWIAHPGPAGPPFPPADNRPAVVAIGPEGGWTEFETGLFSAAGFTPFSPTSRILRTDTFCLAALARFACADSPAPAGGVAVTARAACCPASSTGP